MENQNEKDYIEIDLIEVFSILKTNLRNIFVVTLCCILCGVAYGFIQSKTEPRYESQSLVRIRHLPSTMQTVGLRDLAQNAHPLDAKMNNTISNVGYGLLYWEQQLSTYVELMKGDVILCPVNEAIKTVGTVQATPVKDTEMIKISFFAGDAEKAQKGNELLIQRLQEYLSQNEYFEMRYVIDEGMGDQKPRVIITENVAVDVINAPTLPKAALATNKSRRFTVGSALLGILLGSGYAVIKAMMNRRIVTEKDVEKYLGIPVLGVVPEEASLTEAMEKRGEATALRRIGGFLWK